MIMDLAMSDVTEALRVPWNHWAESSTSGVSELSIRIALSPRRPRMCELVDYAYAMAFRELSREEQRKILNDEWRNLKDWYAQNRPTP